MVNHEIIVQRMSEQTRKDVFPTRPNAKVQMSICKDVPCTILYILRISAGRSIVNAKLKGGNGRAPNPVKWFDVRSTVGRWLAESLATTKHPPATRLPPGPEIGRCDHHFEHSPIRTESASLQHTIRQALHTISWYCALIVLLYAPRDQALADRRATRTRNETDHTIHIFRSTRQCQDERFQPCLRLRSPLTTPPSPAT